MKKTKRTHKYLLLVSAIILSIGIGRAVFAQHEGHDMSKMPGMSKAKPKTKAKTKRKLVRKRKPAARKKQRVKKHDMSSMPGMNMPGHQMPASSPTPNPQASPHQMDMNMPGMNMPANSPTPNPQASPHQMDMNMPGHQMPVNSPSPNPQASPHQMDMNPSVPAASPSSGTTHTHGEQPGAMGNMDMSSANGAQPGSMNMGPLMVMSGNDIGIRVGSSDTNLMSMGAMGSGTTWQPSSGPMHMIHKQSGDWLLMFHYNAVIGVNRQGGPRGVTKFESSNWFMPMAYHKLGKGTLQLRSMFSFEPFTFPPGGSPLLFQTGETFKGQPLIDKQHPHDLFMELSAQYTHPLGERATWFTYFGYPGEPALGPVAFMHRMSASENPSATLAHHLQDSTHISFGVLTTGFTYRWLKLEGSVFNGREPDENRYNFDAHKWNSRSARVSIMPNPNWVIQASYGFLRSPEAAEPGTDIRRTTASVQYNRPLKRGNWASAFVWGRNHTSSPGETHNLNGYTFESTVNFLDKNYLYTRLELVDKNELLRAVDRALLGITDDHPSFRIGAYTFGGARDVVTSEKLTMAVGSDLTFYSKPAVLDQLYGNNPVSWKLFLRFRPGKMDMSSMHGTH
ncbi:MAG TPA: hypothetical protein DC047_12635 [Blastocatellia bacterium]|nr:hypothetical protein [Blastocatellia bacterium]